MSRLLKSVTFLTLSFLALSAYGAAAPHQVLRNATDQLFEVFKSERGRLKDDPARIYALVDDTLGPYVDFPLVSQLVLGKHWRTATPEQRQRFTTEFHKMLVRFYTSAFVDDPRQVDDVLANSKTIIQFTPAEIRPDGVRASVTAEVHLPSGQVVPVNFALHRRGGEWKVYDVGVEGISLVTNYRSSFAAEIQQSGLDAFLDRLAARNREFLAKSKS